MEMEWKKKRQIKWKQNLMEWNRNGMEMEWKKKQQSSGNKIQRNGVELEWKWNGKFSTEKDNMQWNGYGMEKI